MGIVYLESSVGCLRIKTSDQAVLEVEFVDAAGEDTDENSVAKQAAQELYEYFHGMRRTFSVPLAPQGTVFQQSVWSHLMHIPFGVTVSYSWLAKKLNNPGAIRAVGQANHVNPIAIMIPCHRVVGLDRSLVGYAGGVWKKRWLLQHEQQVKEGTRTVPLTAFL